MAVLPANQAVTRFNENEDRVDIFVNQNGNYLTNEATPRAVETLPSFISRKDTEINQRYSTFNSRGGWTTSTAYVPNDLVVDTGIVYVCLIAHTAGTFATDLAASKWAVYQGATRQELLLSTASNQLGHEQDADATPTTVGAALRALFQKGATLTAFGDSFTYGVDSSGSYTTENFANFISRATGLPITNKAISGGLLIDLGSNIYNTTTSKDDVFITMTGYNDGRVYGDDSNGLASYRGLLRAMLVWLSLPHLAKLLASSASVTYSGTWTTLTTVYDNKSTSKYTLTAGSTATAAVKGDAVYIGHTRSTSTPAVFSVSIDGRNYGTFTNTAWTAHGAMTYGPDLLRIGGLQSTKSHQVVITHISGGEFYLDYIAGNGGANVAYPCPMVFSANTVRMLDYSHELSSDLVVDKYNLIHRQVIAELVSDGLNIMHVDTSSGYDPETHGSSNPLEVHPNLIGEHYLADTFLQAMAQDSKAVDKNRRLENYTAVPGLYLATANAETSVSATVFSTVDFNSYVAPAGWVYLPGVHHTYFPQTPGYVEMSVTLTFKAPMLAGRYFIEIFDDDLLASYVLYDELRPATTEAYTVNSSIILYANGIGTRFKVRVYSSVATTIAAGQGLTRFQAKFLGQ